MQSFLESLTCYSRFIEDFEIDALVLYEMREADFHDINRTDDAFYPTGDNAGVDRDLDLKLGTVAI